jgi:hypothetical protein
MKDTLGTIAIWLVVAVVDSESHWEGKMLFSKQHHNSKTMQNPQAVRLRIKILVF